MSNSDLQAEALLDARIVLDRVVRIDAAGWQQRFEEVASAIAKEHGVGESELRAAWIRHNVPGRLADSSCAK